MQFFPEDGEQIQIEPAESQRKPSVSLDLQDVIGIEGPQGPQGAAGQQGKSAMQVLIDGGQLSGTASVADFLAAIKGDDGTGVSIVDITVGGVSNTKVEHLNCIGNICDISEKNDGEIDATKTSLVFRFSNNTTKTVEFLCEAPTSQKQEIQYVYMSESDYEGYFGETTPQGVQVYTNNDVTIYAVPVNQMEVGQLGE